MSCRLPFAVLLQVAVLLFTPFVGAQVGSPKLKPPAGTPPATPATGAATVSELIKVTIYPSRSEVVPNGSYGVYADLENISSFPVMIFPNQTALVVLPEAAEPSACVDWEPGIFPTEHRGQRDKKAIVDDKARLWDDPLVIQRGEHYVVFWDLEPATGQSAAYNGKCELPPQWISALGFVPGDYAFTVEGNAYIQPTIASTAPTATSPTIRPAASAAPAAPAALAEPHAGASPTGQANSEFAELLSKAMTGEASAHHFSETKTLRVGLSQLSTLLAAMIGAFIAYWVIALRPGKDWDAFISIVAAEPAHPAAVEKGAGARKFLAFLALARNALLAAILGGVVTIVASRLSDTHFPVKVSVNDWWGALTIGFVAYFLGNKFVDSLANLGNSTTGSTIGQPPTTPTTPTVANHPTPPTGTVSAPKAVATDTPVATAATAFRDSIANGVVFSTSDIPIATARGEHAGEL